MQNKIVTMLSSIRKYPGMYIGTKSLKLLKLYLFGYIHAMDEEGIDCGADIYYRFNEWMAERYIIEKTALWDDYLPDFCDDEEAAFDLFFKEFFYYVNVVVENVSYIDAEDADEIRIRTTSEAIMSHIQNKNSEGLLFFWSEHIKGVYKNKIRKVTEEFFDFIDGDIISFKYKDCNGGFRCVVEDEIRLSVCYPKFVEVTTNNDKKYNIDISYTHIDKDTPENKGVNGMRIYGSSDKAESLTIGIYDDKRALL